MPVSAEAYADVFFGATPTPWGDVPGLGADAATVNPLLGRDSLDPLIDRAAGVGAGIFLLVRTSNPGAADILDADTSDGPLHERIARLAEELAPRLQGEGGLSGVGAVVGATEPKFIARLRELMPRAVLLLPGVGAQGGDAGLLGAAFAPGRASALVTASRSVCGADDPAEAAAELRDTVWAASA